jgi:hypothetical protein
LGLFGLCACINRGWFTSRIRERSLPPFPGAVLRDEHDQAQQDQCQHSEDQLLHQWRLFSLHKRSLFNTPWTN